MADEQEPTETQESEGSALRKKLEEVLAENKAYKARERERAFKDAGYDPQDGHGKALAKLYDGDPDPAAIAQFAKDEFGWEPPAATPSPEQQRAEGEQRLQQLNSNALPPRDPSDDDLIAKAEAEGDWLTFNRLNAQKLQKARAS